MNGRASTHSSRGCRAAFSVARCLHAALLIALLFVGRVAESIHSAQAGHVVCPEHGEILHVASLEEGATDASVPVGARATPAAGPLEHDHCFLGALLWSSGASWTLDSTCTRAVDGALDTPQVTVRGARFALPPLCFAPKHSPPARAV